MPTYCLSLQFAYSGAVLFHDVVIKSICCCVADFVCWNHYLIFLKNPVKFLDPADLAASNWFRPFFPAAGDV